MRNPTTSNESIDFRDVMETSETGKLLHCSGETVRQLTERDWHPLPCINTGMGRKRQRIFLRPSVLRWMKEEERLGSSEPSVHPRAATGLPAPAPQPTTGSPLRRGRPRKKPLSAASGIADARVRADAETLSA